MTARQPGRHEWLRWAVGLCLLAGCQPSHRPRPAPPPLPSRAGQAPVPLPRPPGPRQPPLPTRRGTAPPPLPTRLQPLEKPKPRDGDGRPPPPLPQPISPPPSPAPEPSPRPVVTLSSDEQRLLDAINALRRDLERQPLLPHAGLQAFAGREAAAWAASLGGASQPPDLNLKMVNDRVPEAFSLSWQEWSAADVGGLVQALPELSSLAEAEMNELGLAVAAGQGGLAAFALLAQTVPELGPDALNHDRPMVYSICVFCKARQYINVGTGRERSSLCAVCRACGRMYDTFAIDTAGQYHRPNSYCERFRPEPEANAMQIWLKALSRVQYKFDIDQYGRPDIWQRARETWSLRHGDCEDSSLVLADWLRANGFDAKVVLGEHDGEGHAWVVLHMDGHDYLLESTGGRGNYHRTPPRAAADPMYVPDAMFNETGIWYRKTKGWTGDYRSESLWGPGPVDPR